MTRDRRIVVVGDVMLDKYTRVKTVGVSKENQAVVVAKEESVDYSLGGAANVARCVKALGGDVTLFGFNSDNRVTHLVDAAKMKYVFDAPTHGHTPVKNRIVTRDGHYLLRLDDEANFFGRPDDWWRAGGDRIGHEIRSAVFPEDRDLPRPVVCLVDYDKGCLTEAAAAAVMYCCNQVHETFKFPVIVDPGRHGLWHKFGSPRTIFRANLYQAMQQFRVGQEDTGGGSPPYPESEFDPGVVQPKEAYAGAARTVCRNLEAAGIEYAYVVLTLGPGGVIVAGPKPDMYLKPAARERVADTCGAGDAVTAAMAVVLAGQEDPLSWEAVTAAVNAAERAASIAVRQPGVYAVTREDMGWFTTSPG